MDVTDIKGQVLKSIPMPVVSLPTEWADAIDWAKSVVTCDRAKSYYSKAWSATKWTARATWNVILVLIGLAMLAVQAWQNRQEVKESVVTVARQTANRIQKDSVYYFLFLRHEGMFAVDSKVIAPAAVVRDRVKASLQVMVQDKEI